MSYKQRKYLTFDTYLDRAFYVAYRRDTFDMIDTMISMGYSSTYAFATVQRIIDNLWERYLVDLKLEQEARERALDLECPWD